MLKSLAIMLAALAQGASALPSTFNLTCKGLRTTILSVPGGYSERPYESVFRIDLKRRLWCEGDCRRSYMIFSFDAGKIVFQKRNKPGDHIYNYVDRREGKHSSLIEADLGTPGDPKPATISDEGTCEPSAFTGLPPIRQRF